MKALRYFAIALVVFAACTRTTTIVPAPVSPTPIADAALDVQAPTDAMLDRSSIPDVAPSPTPCIRRGTNLSGAEFAGTILPGVHGRDYTWDLASQADYFLDRKMNHFRIPFRHERIQRKLMGPLDETELTRMKALLTHITKHGATVMVEPHNSYRYGLTPVTEDQIYDFWFKLASELKSDPLVQINSTNEPNGMSTETIVDLHNASLRAIRAAGFPGLVATAGNGWGGASHWDEAFNGTTPSSKLMANVHDPLNNLAMEAHLYLDPTAAGLHVECVSPTIGVERLQAFTAWLRVNHRRGVLGEIGAIDTPTCKAAVRNALNFVEANRDVYLSYAWWGSGAWSFATTYPLSIGPSTPEKPQLGWLREFLNVPCDR